MATYYGNRGRSFEDFITFANEKYRSRGEAVIWKVPTSFLPIRNKRGEIVSCKVEEKSCTDYLGRVGSRPFAAEAKSTKDKSISFLEVKDHQAAFLDDFTSENEAIGLVIVTFNFDSFWAIPWPFWRAARNAWIEKPKSKVTVVHDGYGWTTPGKASVSPEELLPEWEIKMGGQIGLDYLRRYL